ncbi:MAG: transcriptional regulator, Crp/Fnr family [Clostridia bacterium]|jgi:CRP/FNR family transcriptional regulator|nr:transcriptional regulator, Crp/Fnr family [Clostridia bacterium]
MGCDSCANCKHRSCSGDYCAKKVTIFSELSNQLLGEVVNNIERKHYTKGDLVFKTGEISDRLYIVNSGRMKIFNYTREGKEQILYLLNEGDFIGELSLLKKTNFEFNAAALEDTSLCTVSKRHFDLIIKQNPDITLRILEALHDRLIKLELLVQNLNTKDIDARIATMLIGFLKESGKEAKNGVLMELPLNREEMGSFIGTTRETISRKLAGMQDEGILEFEGNKKVIIKDISALEQLI